MLLHTVLTEEHIPEALQEKGKVTVCDSSPVAIIEQWTTPANAVVGPIDNGDATEKSHYETGNDDNKEAKHSIVIYVGKEIVF